MPINQVRDIQGNLHARCIISCQNMSSAEQKWPIHNLKNQIYIYTK
jgi:hypothetical protein